MGDKYRPKPEIISSNPKTALKQKPGQKRTKIWLDLKNVSSYCLYGVLQGSATYGPRAKSGPPRHFTRPATIYCHPAGDLFSFSIIVRKQ